VKGSPYISFHAVELAPSSGSRNPLNDACRSLYASRLTWGGIDIGPRPEQR